MLVPPLRTDLDTAYLDSGTDPTVQLHQQHHDAIHGVVNNISTFNVARPVQNPAVDLSSINAQIALANVLGGIVQLCPGTYFVDGPLTALASGVELRGHGPVGTVIRTSSTTADIVVSSSASCIGVRDLQLESLVTRTAGAAISFTSVASYIIDNVRFVDTYNLGTFLLCNTGWLSRIKVAHGAGVINRGFWWQTCVDTHVQQVLINGGTGLLPAGNAWFQIDSGCDTWAMMDGSIGASSGSGRCLYFTHSLSPSSFAPRWIKVTNCWFEGSSGVAGAGSNCVEISDALNAYFTNIYCATGTTGIYVSGGRDLRFNQAVIINQWLWGAVVSGTAGPYDVTFVDCAFDSNSQGLTNNDGHLYIGGDTRGCHVRDTYFGQSMLGRVNKPSFAIENSVAQGNDTQISGCRFAAADYGTGIMGGTNPTLVKMRDNAGYNPVGLLGPPAVPLSNVAYINAYGVDASVFVRAGTVTGVSIGGVGTGLTGGMFRVPVGQTIAITYSSVPTWVWIGD